MDFWNLRCKNCDYKAKVEVGTPTPEQTYSDLNEDFSYYKLFICDFERNFVSANIYDRTFDGKCQKDDNHLREVEVPPKQCPRCKGEIEAAKLEVLEPD